jgi:LPS export ABC transporter protein LptC
MTGATTAEELVYRRIVDGKERGIVKAKAMVGQDKEGTRLRGVDASFGHLYEGKEGSTRIVADECIYDAEKQKASFHGNVVVTTTEGLEVRSPSLTYNGVKELVRTEDAVEFSKGNVSGHAVGMEYEAKAGQLALRKDVSIRIVHDEGPPTDIRSGSASASKLAATMKFVDAVEITQGDQSLKAQTLNLNLSSDLAYVYRAVAIDDMELRAGGPATNSGRSPLGGDSPRVLKGRKLDAWFDESTHKIRQAMAGPEASLEVAAAKGSDERSLTARFIDLRFDAEGRPRGDLRPEGRGARVHSSGKGKSGGRTVRCFTLIGRTDPATGAIVNMDFQGESTSWSPSATPPPTTATTRRRDKSSRWPPTPACWTRRKAAICAPTRSELRGRSGDVSAREKREAPGHPALEGGGPLRWGPPRPGLAYDEPALRL